MESAAESASSANMLEYKDIPEMIYLEGNGCLPQTVKIKEEPRDYSDDPAVECTGKNK